MSDILGFRFYLALPVSLAALLASFLYYGAAEFMIPPEVVECSIFFTRVVSRHLKWLL